MSKTPDRKAIDAAHDAAHAEFQRAEAAKRASVRPYIRWMIRRDMAEVLEIERQSFEYPWSEEDFVRCLRQRSCIGMVATDVTKRSEPVIGFFIYELHRTRLHLLNFAVHPDCRRHGVGRTIMEKMKAKLSVQRRMRIVTEVRESNLTAQLFLKSTGFNAVSVLRDFYDDTAEDAYLMQYRYVPPPASDFAQVVEKHPHRFRGFLQEGK